MLIPYMHQHKRMVERLWLTWGPTTPGGPGGPVLPWNPYVFQTKTNSTVIQLAQQSNAAYSQVSTHSLSSLSGMSRQSIFPCRSLRYTHKSVSVILQNNTRKDVMRFCTQNCVRCLHSDSRVGLLVLGNLLVPEGLADPKNKWMIPGQ